MRDILFELEAAESELGEADRLAAVDDEAAAGYGRGAMALPELVQLHADELRAVKGAAFKLALVCRLLVGEVEVLQAHLNGLRGR